MVGSAATYMNSYEMFECWKTFTLESVFNVDSSKLKGLEGKERRMRILKEVLISCFYPEFLIDINRIRNLMYAS